MSPKKKFYAVYKGKKPGIYTEWSGPNGAEEQVKGIVGAVHHGFATRQEAENFLNTGKVIAEKPQSKPKKEPFSGAPSYQEDLAAGKVIVFTDGASTGNPGPGGYGVVMLIGEERRELSGGFRCTTNNRMELMACIRALESLPQSSKVILHSDSTYVVNAVQKGWARRWKANGWMLSTSSNRNPGRAENIDLWEQFLNLLDRHAVELRWVKGHARVPENERCDYLAVQAAHKAGLPLDAGFDLANCK